MSIQPRREVQSLQEAIHGGIDAHEWEARGIDPQSVIDFSTNVNPFGPSPKVHAALQQVPLDRYPDRDALTLRRAIAGRIDVSPERIIAGNGVNELLYLIGLAYVRPGDSALIIGPTYAEYSRAAALMGARCLWCSAAEVDNFEPPIAAATGMLQAARPRLCFLCNPNNPTGQIIPSAIIRNWSADFVETLFVVDEAYVEFVPQCDSMVRADYPNIIVLRSLTKAFGLAGLRLGYAVAEQPVVNVLKSVRTPWSASALAQAAGVAAVEDDEHLPRCIACLAEAKDQLVQGLNELRIRTVPSTTPYFLAQVGNASHVRGVLMESRILVRDCTSFGLPEYIRLSPQSHFEKTLLLNALRQIMRY